MNGEQIHATEGPIAEGRLGRFQMDYPLANFDASDAASAIAKAADIALILDDAGMILDVAVNAEELARANVERWIGRNIADIVTIESRPKIAALLDDDTAIVKQFLRGEADGPVAFHYSDDDFAADLLGDQA